MITWDAWRGAATCWQYEVHQVAEPSQLSSHMHSLSKATKTIGNSVVTEVVVENNLILAFYCTKTPMRYATSANRTVAVHFNGGNYHV